MQTPTKLAVVLTLLSSTALAEIPCDYKVNDNIIYEGKIESVRLVSKSVEKVPKVKDIQAIHKEPAYNHDVDLPQTMKFHNQGLWLPFYAEITRDEQDYVIEVLKRVLDELR